MKEKWASVCSLTFFREEEELANRGLMGGRWSRLKYAESTVYFKGTHYETISKVVNCLKCCLFTSLPLQKYVMVF